MDLIINSEYIEEHHLIIVTVSGDYVLSSDTGLSEKYIKEIAEKQCKKVLVDYRTANCTLETVPTYARPELFKSKILFREIRIASIFSKPDSSTNFYETVMQNRQWDFCNFDDYDKAIAWLLE